MYHDNVINNHENVTYALELKKVLYSVELELRQNANLLATLLHVVPHPQTVDVVAFVHLASQNFFWSKIFPTKQ